MGHGAVVDRGTGEQGADRQGQVVRRRQGLRLPRSGRRRGRLRPQGRAAGRGRGRSSPGSASSSGWPRAGAGRRRCRCGWWTRRRRWSRPPGATAEDLHSLIEDMIRLLESKVQPDLRRGRYPDRKSASWPPRWCARWPATWTAERLDAARSAQHPAGADRELDLAGLRVGLRRRAVLLHLGGEQPVGRRRAAAGCSRGARPGANTGLRPSVCAPAASR